MSDEKVIEQGFDLDEYQLLLLQQKIGVQPGFANNLNKSLTLKRITMMNQKKSNSVAKLKVLLAIPVIAVSLFLFSFNSSQVASSNNLPNPTEIKDTMPVFPGGEAAIRQYIADNVVYPKEAVEKNYQDNVYVSYTINKVGKVVNVEVLKGKYEILNNEAIRVVSSLPDYEPAMKDGKAIEVTMTVPINFKLSDK
ncbi:MAG: TonB family protein [Bacteroidales bacterium]|nr:TonB family protein [Bacteroidales bacterium]